MDWELYERYRATLGFAGVVLLSFLLLAFQESFPVKLVKILLVRGVLPTERFISHISSRPPMTFLPVAATPVAPEASPSHLTDRLEADQPRALRALVEENARLRALLRLKEDRWPRAVAAQVVARDPRRWFREVVLDKGSDDGFLVDDPVVTIEGAREALIGRLIEVSPHIAKVMLLQDPLSAVAATISGVSSEDGVVEGTDQQELILRYLRRDSPVKIGDLVSSSSLGKIFPEGIPIGWVEEVSPDNRELFMEARLRPAGLSHPLRLVFVLVKRG